MNPRPLSAPRLLGVAAFALTCFCLMLYLWNAFGGAVPFKPNGYRVTVALPEADLLAVEADVRISGVTIGRVVAVAPGATATDPNRKDAILEIDPAQVPLRRDVRAMIRRKSLAGEEYLELTPGGPRAPAVPDGGRLAAANVSAAVEIDEVLRTFDEPTRRSFGQWMQAQSQSFAGRGADLNDALGMLPAFEADLTGLLSTLNRQGAAVQAAVRNTGVVFDALSERRGALEGAIVNGRRATDAFAEQDEALADTFRALPTFEAESRRLLARAERFRRNADPVLTALRPGMRALSAAAVEVPATARELDGLMHGVRDITAAGERGLPATRRFLDDVRPFTAEFVPFLGQLAPLLGYVSPNADTVNTLVANLTAVTQATAGGYGGEGEFVHYARAGMALGPDSLALYPHRLPGSRSNAYDSGTTRFSAKQPYAVFDDRNCARPLTFPKLGSADPAAAMPTELIERLRHFVLNDDQPIAPPCELQQTPGGVFPNILPLSQTPRGAP